MKDTQPPKPLIAQLADQAANPSAKAVQDAANRLALRGAIKSEIERNAKTLKIEVDTQWVENLSLSQLKGVWDTMSRVRDAAVHDAMIR